MFDKNLAEYAINLFKRDGISIKTEHHIMELRAGLPGSTDLGKDGGFFTLKTKEEGESGVGMCVWSTGLMMNPFIQKSLDEVHTYPSSSAKLSTNLSVPPENRKWFLKWHPKTGSLMVDNRVRVKLIPQSSASDTSRPVATMQDVFAVGDVSALEVRQLPATAQVANQEAKWLGKRFNGGDLDTSEFTFRNLGVMTYLGNMRAILQSGTGSEFKG
jgi:NADH dehydrogenase FAD-containing subunit